MLRNGENDANKRQENNRGEGKEIRRQIHMDCRLPPSEKRQEEQEKTKGCPEKKKEHITGGRLCRGVNGVPPLPVLPVPFEPWPLHTERSLTLSSASSGASSPRRQDD